jgi:hypothetical protein
MALVDAACYASQGIVDAEEVSKMAAVDSWWQEMERDLADAEAGLSLVRMGGGDTQAVLGNNPALLRQCIEKIRELENLSDSPSYDKIREIYESLDTLRLSLKSIMKTYSESRKLVSAIC